MFWEYQGDGWDVCASECPFQGNFICTSPLENQQPLVSVCVTWVRTLFAMRRLLPFESGDLSFYSAFRRAFWRENCVSMVTQRFGKCDPPSLGRSFLLFLTLSSSLPLLLLSPSPPPFNGKSFLPLLLLLHPSPPPLSFLLLSPSPPPL